MSKIVELLPPNLTISTAEADALLELAYLVTAADGHLADVELAAFSALASKLRGGADVDDLIGRFADKVDSAEIEARVRELAPLVPKQHHDLAYKLALGIALVDYDPSTPEDRLHSILGDALGISPDRRAALSREVGLGGGKGQ
jgi:hypothetical protein